MSARRYESSSPCNGAPRKVVPRGGTKRGNNTVEGRGNKAAEDDNEGRNRRAWQQGRGRRGRQRKSEERAAGGRNGRLALAKGAGRCTAAAREARS
jgi:hypothetical protein